MKNRIRAALTALALLLLAGGVAHGQEVTCADYALISGPIFAAGDTNGGGPFEPFQTVTITLTAGTATSANWNIVGSASGSPVLAGPGGLGSTLTYTAPASGAPGIGYFITSINGTAQITASCAQGVVPSVPTLDNRALAVLAMLLSVLAGWRMRRRVLRR